MVSQGEDLEHKIRENWWKLVSGSCSSDSTWILGCITMHCIMVDGCGGQYWVQWRPSRQIASSKDTNPYFLAFSAAFIILHSVPTSVAIVCNWSCCSRNMSEHVSHRKQLRTQRFSSDQSMWSPNRFSFLAHFGGRNHWRASPNPGRGFQQLSSVFTGHLYIYTFTYFYIFFLLPAISRRSKVFTNNLCFKPLTATDTFSHSSTRFLLLWVCL